MNPSLLEELGLRVKTTEAGTVAELDLVNALVNPLTRNAILRVTFQVQGDRLVVTNPAELEGVTPLSLARVEKSADLELSLSAAFHDHIFHLQRRSAELQSLGLSPKVDPASLQLSSELGSGKFRFVLGTDRRGNLRLLRAFRENAEIPMTQAHSFELSEFREKSALAGYLQALVAEPHDTNLPPENDRLLTFGEVAQRFGAQALLPPKSSLEILVELTVQGQPYRFAAARVMGRSFRGLLAGSSGKIWAERFELDQFPGVERLISQLLRVPLDSVKVLSTRGVS